VNPRAAWILWMTLATLVDRTLLPRTGVELLAAGPHLALALALVLSLRLPREELPWVALAFGTLESGTAGVAWHAAILVALGLVSGTSLLSGAFRIADWRRVTLLGCTAHLLYGTSIAIGSATPDLFDVVGFVPAAGLTGLATAGTWRIANRIPGLRIASSAEPRLS